MTMGHEAYQAQSIWPGTHAMNTQMREGRIGAEVCNTKWVTGGTPVSPVATVAIGTGGEGTVYAQRKL